MGPVSLVNIQVHFNLEPEYIPVESELSVHHQCTCHQRNPDKYAYIQVCPTSSLINLHQNSDLYQVIPDLYDMHTLGGMSME